MDCKASALGVAAARPGSLLHSHPVLLETRQCKPSAAGQLGLVSIAACTVAPFIAAAFFSISERLFFNFDKDTPDDELHAEAN
jgi:hypothetical protein